MKCSKSIEKVCILAKKNALEARTLVDILGAM
jgi:hypothetical protein